MTHNATISIAAKWYDDMNNAIVEARGARAGEEELLRADPDLRLPEQARRLADGVSRRGQDRRRSSRLRRTRSGRSEFVTFLLQDENLTPYVEGSLGRWYPVTKAGAARLSFWLADPHRTSVQKQFVAGTTPFEFTKNYKFTVLNNENIWAKAMNRVVSEKWTVDKAVDEMIARIKQVAG